MNLGQHTGSPGFIILIVSGAHQLRTSAPAHYATVRSTT